MLTTSYPRFEGDVAGAFVRGMARALAARGHEIEVLAPEPREPTAPPADEGVRVRWVRYAWPRGLRRTFYGAGVPDNVRDPRAWPGLITYPIALERAARAHLARCDAFVSHWALPCALVGGAVRGHRRHVAVLHSADVHLVRRLPLRSRWARAIANGASELVFSSAALRTEFLSWLPAVPRADVAGRSHVSAMGIELAELPARREARRELGADGFVVLALGRLVPIKGIDVALRALAGEGRRALWIAGDGPARPALEALARELSVDARFFGTVAGARKAALLAAADAFVLPSTRTPSGRTEGMPTALLEAAAAGLAIVASDVGGVGELFVSERSALLVPPGDVLALRAAIGRLARERGLRRRLGRAARTVARRYAWAALAPRFEALLAP